MKNNKILKTRFAVVLFSLFFSINPLIASPSGGDHGESEEFNPGELILHHIQDDYSWHFFSVGDFHASVYLPVILYSPEKGISIFSAKRFFENDMTYEGYVLDHGNIHAADHSTVIDVSITKNVLALLISAFLMFWIFISLGKTYTRRGNKEPRGFQNFLEIIIVFLKDELAIPILGDKWQKYFGFLVTVFFFIWINNLLGLLPGAANVTGNIAVTLALALITFVVVQFSGNKHYWGHIFAPPVPVWLWIIMIPVELLGIFTKPFALMVRLFANITAGHILILSVIGLIFIFGQNNTPLGFGVSFLAVPFSIFLYFLELLVAVIQAYIFTILSAVFISQAIESYGHHDEEAEKAMERETSH